MAWATMTTRSAGYVVPASEWNQLIANDNYLYANYANYLPLAGATMTGDITMELRGIIGHTYTLNDDTAVNFTPAQPFGVAKIWTRVPSATWFAIVMYDMGQIPYTMALGTATNLATGVLTGTTGSDAKLTISTHTDNKMYIENRVGATKTIHVILEGA